MTLAVRLRRHVLDAELEVQLDPTGPVTVLFGPSGAGKTTLLRCVAGLDRPEPGSRVALDDQEWTGARQYVPPQHRPVGYLFQEHALFPHLSVLGNVSYGLHRLPRAQRPRRAAEALAATRAGHLVDTPTPRLSGGEGQRVALARALAPEPRLLLLDEPLSALDTPTRLRLRGDLRDILLRLGTPTLMVTHDLGEALAMGDRIAVLVDGRVHQHGPARGVFARPATVSAARALGMDNLLPGHVTSTIGDQLEISVGAWSMRTNPPSGAAGYGAGDAVMVGVRAEEICVTADTEPDARVGDAACVVRQRATVTAVTPEGSRHRLELDVHGVPMVATVANRDAVALCAGQRVSVTVPGDAVHLIPHHQPSEVPPGG
ncbi:ABC transporter ATP-binding protein [Lipingzhangella sp. LS1_29]|uniref:ABC transporter ATP-binding protein n=1 Tax=Lipingzhangella rawalii TaxID=2055835 RepID=A0ABU2H667_9ACTN|nr:ABC transporter ATP-binding protein [Lipingzhangella rawalii]MDS1270124.1 ABC transporter ATP-binding protein [Lipingzhangella rawalii]